tara:strand:+ start:954 stop:2165 length:1212 start_codon:yes stop_codon:yes gene_type:complete
MNKILLSTLFLFSTTIIAQSWERLSNIPIGKHHFISFSLDGKGYAVTGTSSLEQATNDVYQYDPITDTWSSLTDFPGAARSFGIGTVANGKAYLGFGANATQFLNDFWSFDPSDSSWTQLASCGCSSRRHPALIAIGDRIYVGLGDNDIIGNLRDWWMYDINANTWTRIADLPGPQRHHPYMFNAGGEVFAGLGHGFNGSFGVIYNSWYKLDTALNTWSAMNNFPGEARVAGTQFSFNGHGYVLSGDGSDHNYMPTGEMWRYNPDRDAWNELTAHPGISRWAPASFVIDNDVYFFGGLNRVTNSFPIDLWKFDLTDTITGLDEQKLILSNTYVYPNPANEFLLWENDAKITDVRVYNTLGKLILTRTAKAKRINTAQFNSGLYLVQFYAKNELIKTSKVLIKH